MSKVKGSSKVKASLNTLQADLISHAYDWAKGHGELVALANDKLALQDAHTTGTVKVKVIAAKSYINTNAKNPFFFALADADGNVLLVNQGTQKTIADWAVTPLATHMVTDKRGYRCFVNWANNHATDWTIPHMGHDFGLAMAKLAPPTNAKTWLAVADGLYAIDRLGTVTVN